MIPKSIQANFHLNGYLKQLQFSDFYLVLMHLSFIFQTALEVNRARNSLRIFGNP